MQSTTVYVLQIRPMLHGEWKDVATYEDRNDAIIERNVHHLLTGRVVQRTTVTIDVVIAGIDM
jgi:hypothetical protein